ncbi:endonuclease V [Nonomuraea guangzhouensis]|uniref:Endonuclease V n=1 Tax=Nonomuraea guangzhouensis TaxID=1291555 RepID=A0ABW4GLD7_9ACTN|nr:endonuclease V [Nonomuraea guangzhouensis]
MRVNQLHPWPTSAEEAEAIQERLRLHVELTGPTEFTLVAGLDVHYHGDDDVAAAVVVLSTTAPAPAPASSVTDDRAGSVAGRVAGGLVVVEQVVVRGKARFPYVPGLFAFRELPALVEALERLTVTPDLLVCDGYGLAHPRGFGLACHLGVLTGLPAIGVGKTHFVGTHDTPAPARGAWTPIDLNGSTVGRALRTQQDVKPVYVSQGHRITLDTACAEVLRLSPYHRLPEPIRKADHLARHGDL